MRLLNTPIKIGHLELKNRLVMPPMATSLASAKGEITKKICDYYDEKSAGGYIGLIITEHSYVSEAGKVRNEQPSIAKDEDVAGLILSTKMVPKSWHRSTMQAVQPIPKLQVILLLTVPVPSRWQSFPKYLWQ